MDTKNLIQLYKSYFKYGNQLEDSLTYGIIHYNFDDIYKLWYELSSYYKDSFKADCTLKTNSNKQYSFYPKSIITKVETKLRFQHEYDKVIFVTDQLSLKKRDLYIYNSNDYSYIVGNSCNDADFLHAVELNLRSKTYIHGYPHSLHQLASNEIFIKKNSHKIVGFINTDCPAFVKHEILSRNYLHFNDQMIDWTSGLNFYTCRFNYKHFLPIFVKTPCGYKNLLNLSQSMYTNDDFFHVHDNPSLCACGKYRCDFNFVPHKRHAVNCYSYQEMLSYANVLNHKIRVFQIIQDRNMFHIFVKTQNSLELSEDIVNFFQNKLENVSWHFDETYRTGFKYPAFWKISNNIYLS